MHDNEVLLDGPQNDFYTSYLLLGGVSNTFTVADGVFMAERVYFLPGSDNTLVFTGGKSVVSNLFRVTEGVVPTNLHVRIAAAGDVTFVNGFSLHGTNAAMSVSGGSLYVPAPKTMVCADDHARLDITGGIVTGLVEFAANHGRVVVGPGARAVATFGSSLKYYAPLIFAPGKTDNALVLSNGTFTSHMVFMGGLVTTEEMPKSEAYPITNVPDCRIEFHGENPCLKVTSNKRYTTDGGPWYAFAIGNSYNPAPLENPLTLKFFLPENGYAQAPVRVEVATAVLGGNAHLDFDVTGFKWPSRTVRIPLIYNASAFKGYNRYTYIDVAGLNATNASRLPSRDGHTAYLACSADGKTLELVVPGNGGTVVLMR